MTDIDKLADTVRSVLGPRHTGRNLLYHERTGNAAHKALSALVAHAKELEQRANFADAYQWRQRAEAAERERDEAQGALQNLAADHYFARAEAAEARADQLAEALREIEGRAVDALFPFEALEDVADIARAALAEHGKEASGVG